MRQHQHVREWDDVIVSGFCFSCPVDGGSSVDDVAGVVGAVCREFDGSVSVKVWPHSIGNDPDKCGKMWFWFDEATFQVLEREDPEDEKIEDV